MKAISGQCARENWQAGGGVSQLPLSQMKTQGKTWAYLQHHLGQKELDLPDDGAPGMMEEVIPRSLRRLTSCPCTIPKCALHTWLAMLVKIFKIPMCVRYLVFDLQFV